VIAEYVSVTGDTQQTEEEHEGPTATSNSLSSSSRVPLSKNELYGLLVRSGGDGSIISQTIDAMERGAGGAPVDLASLCAVLQAKGCGAASPAGPARREEAPHGVAGAKRDREEDGGDVAATTADHLHGPCAPPLAPSGGCGLPADLLAEVARTALPGATVVLDAAAARQRELDETNEENIRNPTRRLLLAHPLNSGGLVAEGDHHAPPQQQVRKKFTKEEDDAILRGIARFAVGPSRFSEIFYTYKTVWKAGRTAAHISDHWRNTLRHRVVPPGGQSPE
jgi:hypothetical protein